MKKKRSELKVFVVTNDETNESIRKALCKSIAQHIFEDIKNKYQLENKIIKDIS